MAEVKPREVPAKQAEKFLEGVEEDPKFQRFQNRQNLSSVATVARTAAYRHRRERKFALFASAFFLFLALVSQTWIAAVVVVGVTVGVLGWLSAQISQLEGVMNAALWQVEDIDREAASGIKIIDPDTFGAPPAPPVKQEAQEA